MPAKERTTLRKWLERTTPVGDQCLSGCIGLGGCGLGEEDIADPLKKFITDTEISYRRRMAREKTWQPRLC